MVAVVFLGTACATGSLPTPTFDLQATASGGATAPIGLVPTPTSSPIPTPTLEPPPSPTPTLEPTPTLTPTALPTPTPTLTAYGLDMVSPTAITFLNKALLRRDLGDVDLLNDLDLSRDYTEQCLLGYRTAWRIVHDDFEIEQSVVPTLYLTSSHDTIRTAIGRDIEHPAPFRTIGHETAHLALRLPISWISEGVAEYVGHATSDQVDPTPDYLGRLYDALSVRRAASVSGAYTIEGLLNWDWGAATSGEAALFYAQSWWFTDYLVGTFGKQDMRGFITVLGHSGL